MFMITFDVWQNALDVGHAAICNEALDGATDHGVFAHQDDTLATEGNSNLVHLVGANIVNVDDEDGGCMRVINIGLLDIQNY